MNGDRGVVVVAGARTPFVKAGTLLARTSAVELGRIAVREAIEQADVDPADLDEVIVGNIAGPADAANIGRVISLMAKVPGWSSTPTPDESPIQGRLNPFQWIAPKTLS